MKMGGDEIINLLQGGDRGGDVMNASGVTAAWITGIDQHRFPPGVTTSVEPPPSESTQ